MFNASFKCFDYWVSGFTDMFRSEMADESDSEFRFVSAVLGPSVTVLCSKSRYSLRAN